MNTEILKSGGMVILSMLLVTLLGCQGGMVGNGHVISRNKEVKDFTRLVITGNFNVYLVPSTPSTLRMEMDENLFDNVKVIEQGSTLRIDTRLNVLQAHEKNLYIGVHDLDKIELSGAIKMVADSVLHSEALNIQVSRAAKLDLGIESRKLRIDLSGASECELRGKSDDFRIQISGAGSINAFELIAKTVKVELSGAGNARVNAKDDLDVNISGVGSVRYRGEPEIHKNISGLGTLKRD